MGKQSLGRGLEGLLGKNAGIIKEIEMNSSRGEANTIPIDQIEPNPYQPRTNFSDEEIAELAATIQKHGLLQPIAVRRIAGENRFELIAGERRLRACRALGMEMIPARIMERVSNRQMAELALIENIQRVDLSPVEQARALQQLINEHDYSHEALAQTLGRSRSAITNTLRLLQLPDEVLQWISEGKLTAGHARALLAEGVNNPVALAKEIIEKGWSVRQAEQQKKIASKRKKSSSKKRMSAQTSAQAAELADKLGAPVFIEEKKGVGKIVISFSSYSDYNRIKELLTR